jgi:molybdopterin-guanine dinucleotide biosynthesis protein A
MQASAREMCLPPPGDTCAVLILAGGLSSRMKREKATLTIQSKSLIEWTFGAASEFTDRVYVSVHDNDMISRFRSLLPPRTEYIVDIQEGPRSVLLALLSSFPRIKEEYVAVIPVDSPLITPGTITTLVSKSKEFELVVPMWPDGKLEAIHAVYNREAILPTIQTLWSEGKLELREIPRRTKNTLFLSTETLSKEDPALLSLLDADTPEEFEMLKLARTNKTRK